ncbi:MAG: 50S ribosomal protein L15 [Planctomycetales bacterium]|nr:50S ribosomal protein L15 [Planctomycetales bacterium]
MMLNDVHRGITKYKKRRRVGRGIGSGHGKTSARGHKGQGSRGGYSRKPTFQGGAMPLVRRVPKRGFNNKWAKEVAIVNVSDLDRVFEAGAEITPEAIRSTPLLGRRFDELKILGDGEITKKFKVSAHRFSASAVEKIEKAGGEVIRLAGPKPVEEKKRDKAKDAS